jgi:hypothetical protein
MDFVWITHKNFKLIIALSVYQSSTIFKTLLKMITHF